MQWEGTMAVRYLSLAAAALLLRAAAPPPAEPVVYSLSVAPGQRLAVEMRLRGDADGETRIELPDEWAGSSELWRGISAFAVDSGTLSGEGAARIIRHAPGAPLVVRYLVASGGSDAETAGQKARPIVELSWFFFHGEGVFAAPEGGGDRPATFRWGALPPGWKTASDLDHLQTRGGTVDDVVESAAIGGPDILVTDRTVMGARLRVAMRGAWDFAPGDLADTVARIMASQHGYWGEAPEPFFVALAPLPEAQGTSYTGTGRGDGFSILSTPGFDLGQATHTLAHEYMHHWVAELLGGFPDTEPGRDFWFSEGLNDFLTARTLLGSGQWTLAQYVENKNDALLRYATSPARAATGAEIAAQFWKDQDFERISYDRGHLLALLIDRRIRTASAGRLNLDDVLRAQRKAAVPGAGTAAALFPRVLRQVTGLDMDAEIARYTQAGDPFLMPADAVGDCGKLVVERRKEFHRGFDIDATMAAGMVIKGTVPNGPAWRAGMRDGMRLVRREHGKIGDSAVELGYRVADAGGERVLTYRPEGTREHDVQRIVTTGPADVARCSTLLGGAK
jgi:predicted metalloprotease with PDZ domain